MITSSCHCGNVKLEIDAELPEWLLSCNCSICRRYGHLMAYYNPSVIRIIAEPGATTAYSWGEKMIAFHHCNTCGCFSYYLNLTEQYKDRMGINARLFDNVDIAPLRIRHFDGADTWKFLD